MVEALHTRLVAEFGGPSGFNDEGLFLSALHRPLNRWHYGRGGDAPPDLFDLAAA